MLTKRPKCLTVGETIQLFCGIEVGLLIAIRDSLLVNVLMLFYSLQSIKQWQMSQ